MIFYDEYINESKGFNQNRSETSKIAALANNPNHKLYNEFDDKSKKTLIQVIKEIETKENVLKLNKIL